MNKTQKLGREEIVQEIVQEIAHLKGVYSFPEAALWKAQGEPELLCEGISCDCTILHPSQMETSLPAPGPLSKRLF